MFRRRWPKVRVGNSLLPGDVKTMSLATLDQLQDSAIRTSGVSATGRPQWVAEHASEIDHVLATVFSPEWPGWHRCIVVPIGANGPMGLFSLGVSFEDFEGLPAVPWPEAAGLLRELLLRSRPISLDSERPSSGKDDPSSG